jgi:hypothetical protein
VAEFHVKSANRLLLRADAFCMYDPTCPFHAEGKGAIVKVCVLSPLPSPSPPFLILMNFPFLQAFGTVLDRALSGGYPNITADDIRAVVSEVFLSGNPDFAALNDALASAVDGNASSLSYHAPIFTQGYATLLPTACLDTREPPFLEELFVSHFSMLRIDIDDDSFAGFDEIRRRIAKDDTARMGYSGDLTTIVRGGFSLTYHP